MPRPSNPSTPSSPDAPVSPSTTSSSTSDAGAGPSDAGRATAGAVPSPGADASQSSVGVAPSGTEPWAAQSTTPGAPIVPVLPLADQRGDTLPRLVGIMRRLLAPDGCPWDREQTMQSLKKYVLEEACEVLDAIDSGAPEAICEEVGDLLLEVVFLAELARNQGLFGPDDVIRAISEKLIRRHPHVFGDVEVRDSKDVLRNWELIKAQEKKDRGLLESVPRSLPALTRAQRIGEKVQKVGFDWPDVRGSRAKVTEETGELDRAIADDDRAKAEEELGDVLFALVNLARHLGLDAEGALRKTIQKFTTRFSHVETRVKEHRGGWPTGGVSAKIPLEELDRYWEEAKRREAGQSESDAERSSDA